MNSHTEKIMYMRNFYDAPAREYLVIYGPGFSGKYQTAVQAYKTLDNSGVHVSILWNNMPTNLGNSAAPIKKNVIIREIVDDVANSYISNYNAEVVQFLPDPVNSLQTIRNYGLEFNKWLRTTTADTGPVLDLIPIRDEYLKLDYENSAENNIIFNYGLRNQSVSITFNKTTFQFDGYSTLYERA